MSAGPQTASPGQGTGQAPGQASTQLPPSRHPLLPIFEAGTLRARCAQVLLSVERGLSAHFVLKRDALAVLAQRLDAHRAAGSAENAAPAAWQAFPWPQLRAAGIDRLADLDARLAGRSAEDQLRARLDLALVTVLLGTDIGPLWHCSEARVLPTAAFVHAQADDLLALLDSAAPPRVTATPATSAADTTAKPADETAAAVPADAAAAQAEAAVPVEAAPPAPAAPPAISPAISPAQPPAPPAAAPLAGAEGLAVAVYRAFVAGAFSAHPHDPCRVDASALRHIDVAALRAVLQGTPTNPVPGLEGRARLLSQWGVVLQELARNPALGGAAAAARASSLLDGLPGLPALNGLASIVHIGTSFSAEHLLTALLRRLAPVWQAGSTVQGLPAGDVWPHLWAGDACTNNDARLAHDRSTGGWAPLHAQGLKLVAALEGPLLQAGCALQAVQALPVSACRSTSALMLRAGVLVPRHASLLQRSLKPGHDAVVECRAATVALFDELALLVQQGQLGQTGQLGQAWRDSAAQPCSAHLVRACTSVLRDAPALQLKVEGDGALF